MNKEKKAKQEKAWRKEKGSRDANVDRKEVETRSDVQEWRRRGSTLAGSTRRDVPAMLSSTARFAWLGTQSEAQGERVPGRHKRWDVLAAARAIARGAN